MFKFLQKPSVVAVRDFSHLNCFGLFYFVLTSI